MFYTYRYLEVINMQEVSNVTLQYCFVIYLNIQMNFSISSKWKDFIEIYIISAKFPQIKSWHYRDHTDQSCTSRWLYQLRLMSYAIQFSINLVWKDLCRKLHQILGNNYTNWLNDYAVYDLLMIIWYKWSCQPTLQRDVSVLKISVYGPVDSWKNHTIILLWNVQIQLYLTVSVILVFLNTRKSVQLNWHQHHNS